MFGLFFLLLIFLLFYMRSLSKRIKKLEASVGLLCAERKGNNVPSVPVSPWETSAPFEKEEGPNDEKTVSELSHSEIKSVEIQKNSLFSFLGQNLNIWFAATAGLLGIFFFVKYSVENSLLSPAARLFVSALMGAAAIISGNALFKRKNFANNERIAQVLTGIGLSALYFTSYALSRVYDLTSPLVSFGLMCFVTALAVSLCFAYRKTPLAVLTVIGGFLTPALVREATGDIYFFTGYSILCSVMFLIIAKKLTSPLLGIFDLTLLFFWVFWQMDTSYAPFDSVLFFCVGGSVFFAANFLFTGEDKRTLLLQKLAGGTVILMMLTLVVRAHYGLLEWGLTGLVCLFLLIKAVKVPEKNLPLFAGMMLIVFLLMSLWTSASTIQKYYIFGGFTVLALLMPYRLLWKRPIFVNYIAALLPVLAAVHYLNFENQSQIVYLAIIGAGLALAPLSKMNFAVESDRNNASKLVLSAAVLAAAGAFCTGFYDYMPLFFTAEAAVLAAVYTKMPVPRLLSSVYGALLFFALCEFKLIFISGAEIVAGRFFDNTMFHEEGMLQQDFLLFRLFLPLCAIAALYHLAAKGTLKNIAAATFGFLAFNLVYILLIAQNKTLVPNFSDRALITNLAFVLYLFFRKRQKEIPAKIFLALTVFRFVLTDLILFNPLLWVGKLTFAELLWGYGFPIILLCAAVLKQKAPSAFQINLAAFLFLVLISFITTYLLFGTLHLNDIKATQAAVFVYSAVWLITGVAELLLSLRIKLLTKPAFVLIYVVVTKVFLYDVSFLQDLWRVACLLGLAASLLGIGHCHAKYFKGEKSAS
ncbi:MAG: DUF2339 domain-containing protein [Alphaproteobacteria bacterium]|nr:DUF2339 domain-containing protein [Alphaproteobacteria bacterium]